eukprot:2924263-Lingulodinium_polyedra.AAC.1
MGRSTDTCVDSRAMMRPSKAPFSISAGQEVSAAARIKLVLPGINSRAGCSLFLVGVWKAGRQGIVNVPRSGWKSAKQRIKVRAVE